MGAIFPVRPRRAGAPRARLAAALLAAALAPAAAAAATAPPPAVLQAAAEVRSLAELGAYGQAADRLRALRARVRPDADLELTLALFEARTGQIDSAAARLWGPLLADALDDTLPVSRRHRTPWFAESRWVNGVHDGWHWYVVRARAEVAARQERWEEAARWAAACVAARPLDGKEWLIRALCAAHAGDLAAARAASRRAAELDPALPEAQHLEGLMAWREGRRAAAQGHFRRAVALDSAYAAPALALLRSRLPSSAPGPWPAELLTGRRATSILSSPARPKEEEFVQMDTPAQAIREVAAEVPDSLRGAVKEARLAVGILIDERGRIVAHDLPWFDPALVPEALVGRVVATFPEWRFRPATRSGAPSPVWTHIELTLPPP